MKEARLLLGLLGLTVVLMVMTRTPSGPPPQPQQQQRVAQRLSRVEASVEARDDEIHRLRQQLVDARHDTSRLEKLLADTTARVEKLAARPVENVVPAPRKGTTQRSPPVRPVSDVNSAAGVGVGVPNKESGGSDADIPADPVVAAIRCPALANQTGGAIPLEHLPRGKPTTVAQKYDRRASNCFKHGLWSSVSLEDHRKIMDVIAGLTHIRKGSLLFDWGCGCGHKLQWFSRTHGTSGLGVDVSAKSLEYAQTETVKANRFCWADGSNLWWVPPNTFDVAFSFGSVFHLYNETLMCMAYKEMVKLVKPGGFVYNGWTAEDEFTNSALYKCLRTMPEVASVQILREYGGPNAIFAGIKTFPTKLKGYGLGNNISRARMPDRRWRKLKPPSYSHLIQKKA
eukprot:TRINITY_DN32247_c0_g1_i1.p1 TRINITY_DN32247_c0_g1~~TRINITY_DN32247_c0_g1_i1.p1  ORF type:complete len:399 (+),score=150.45 TRINITY_DN32247_c0_g1_i1:73-1269(+)